MNFVARDEQETFDSLNVPITAFPEEKEVILKDGCQVHVLGVTKHVQIKKKIAKKIENSNI